MLVNVAVVGAGHWGPNLIRSLHDRSASFVSWVADPDESRLRRVQERFPEIRVTRSIEDLMEDSTVDAVVVATPTSTHHDLALRAIATGKHVLVEKPLTHSVLTSRELAERADAAGVVLMVGHLFLYNAAVGFVRDYLRSGDLGAVHYLSMTRTNLGPIRNDVNAAWDLAAHDISIANYWLGAAPVAVTATGGSWLNQGIHDAVFATLRYPGNTLVALHVSWLSPRKSREITVVGERKMLTFDDMNLVEPVRIYDKRVLEPDPGFYDTFGAFRTSVREGDILIPRVGGEEPLRAECADFIRCVRTGERPVSTPEVGLAVVRALEAIDRSIAASGTEKPVGA